MIAPLTSGPRERPGRSGGVAKGAAAVTALTTATKVAVIFRTFVCLVHGDTSLAYNVISSANASGA